MDNNKRTALKLFAIAGTLMAISLLFCLIAFNMLPFWSMLEKTDYEISVDKDSFFLDCNYFSGTESRSFELIAGDEIEVNYVWMGGRFDVTIGQLGKEAIYTGNDIRSGAFVVEVQESGVYEIKVNGKEAEGSLVFQIKDDE